MAALISSAPVAWPKENSGRFGWNIRKHPPGLTSPTKQSWAFHDISGRVKGIKYDRIEMLDIDRDGDLDLLTCEERDNLGVIWYENPR